jgi:hypothetical protein
MLSREVLFCVGFHYCNPSGNIFWPNCTPENNVGNFSALTSYYIHSSLVNNGLSVNGSYRNILGEVPITVTPGELLNYKALAPAIAFNANELIGTTWTTLQFWISSQTDAILNMNGESFSFSITAIVSY